MMMNKSEKTNKRPVLKSKTGEKITFTVRHMIEDDGEPETTSEKDQYDMFEEEHPNNKFFQKYGEFDDTNSTTSQS